MQEVHDGVAARSGEKSMVKKLHSLLRTKKNTRNKKAEEYLSTQDHHVQFLYCFFFSVFFC